MISFSKHRLLAEMSMDDLRKEMIDMVGSADPKELVTYYRAMQSSVERRMVTMRLSTLFKDRGLGEYVNKGPYDEFMRKILSLKQSTEDKIDWLDGMIEGRFFDSAGFIKGSAGNIKKHFTFSNPVMKDIFPWLLTWKADIDVVATGPAEALLIFSAKGGGKGAPYGDAKIGSNMIEVKVPGGSMGKGGAKYWGDQKDWFYKTAVQMVPALKDVKKDAVVNMSPLGATSHNKKSIAMNTLAAKMAAAGNSDAAIGKFWVDFIEHALKVKVKGKLRVSNGVVNYDDWSRLAAAAAIDKYKEQTGFTMLTLITKDTGDYLNFTSGADMINNSNWNYDSSLTWLGGGQGGGLSPRIGYGSVVQPTYASNEDIKAMASQYEDISKFVRQAMATASSKKKDFTRADTMLKSLKVDPKVDHTVKITGQIRDAKQREALMMRTKVELERWYNGIKNA